MTVQFTDQSSAEVTGWLWNFGDAITSTLQNPEHTYSDVGTYTVTLLASSPGGSDLVAKPDYITVTPVAPTAAFSATPLSGVVPLSVSFTNASIGEITSWSWTFGDGSTSAQQNPAHIYTEAGTYTVTLVVTGPGGSDQLVKTNYITVTQPRRQRLSVRRHCLAWRH